MAKCSKYHAKCKVTMPKCSKYHAKWQVLVQNCCKYKANGTGKESKKQIQNLRQKKQQKLFYTQKKWWLWLIVTPQNPATINQPSPGIFRFPARLGRFHLVVLPGMFGASGPRGSDVWMTMIHHSSPRIGHDPLVEDQLFHFDGSPVWGISWEALSGGATKPWRSLEICGASCESPRFIRRANQVQGPKLAGILGGDE